MEHTPSAMAPLNNNAISWPQDSMLSVGAVSDICAASADGCVLIWDHHVGALDKAAALQRP